MTFLFVHLPDGTYDAAIDAALADSDSRLVDGAADRVMEGALTSGRSWLAAYDDAGAARAAAERLADVLADAGDAAALLIEGNGAALSPAETVYLVANHTVTDADRFRPYIADVARVTAMFSGRFLARAGRTESVAGAIEAGRSVILAFADRAAAERFYAAPEYAPLLELRLATTRPNMFLVPAVENN